MQTLYTPKEVCQQLKISPSTFRRLKLRGAIETIKVGDQLRITASALESFLAKAQKEAQR